MYRVKGVGVMNIRICLRTMLHGSVPGVILSNGNGRRMVGFVSAVAVETFTILQVRHVMRRRTASGCLCPVICPLQHRTMALRSF